MATQPPTTTDAPFGLQPNVAAGLAYLFGIIGGIIMLVGGGTNKFVKWAAAQAITLGALYFVAYIAIMIINVILGIIHLWVLWPLMGLLGILIFVAYLIAWIYTTISGFQGKEVRLPFVADLTMKFFGAQVA